MRYLFNPGAVFQFNSFLRFVKTIRIYSIPVCSGCDTSSTHGLPRVAQLSASHLASSTALFNSYASMPKLSSDNELACKLFFNKANPENAYCENYLCKVCGTKRRKNKSGCTNLTDHLTSEHPKWKEALARAKSKADKGGAMTKFLKYTNIYRCNRYY